VGSSPHGTFHETATDRAEDAFHEAKLAFYGNLKVDLRAKLEEYAQLNRDAAKCAEESGDEYDLKDFYLNEADYFERLAAGSLPSDPVGQIEIYTDATGRWTSEGCGNLLDFRGVSDSEDVFRMRRMPPVEVERFFGSQQPSRAQIEAGWDQIWEKLDRGTGVCCRYFEGKRPVGWYFLGATAD
jgi:hypothetical protein